jgi:hypothetical protein
MEQRSPSPEAAAKSPNSLPLDDQTTPNPFIYPSGIPGMGNCILGPRVPESPANISTTAVSNHEKSLMPTTTKRKLSEVNPTLFRTKPDHLPPGFSRGIATSVVNSQKHVHFNHRSGDHQQSSNLAHIVQNTEHLLTPYTNLHPSCAATQPLQIIHASLSSSSFTPMTLMCLLTDTRELLKVLVKKQTGIYQKFEPALARLQRAGMDSILLEAREKAQNTEQDVQQLGRWIQECDAM